MTTPELSLVVATRGRTGELERLLRSLAVQSWRDFDVTVVDQNAEGILDAILATDWPFSVQHIRTPAARGACRARNVGWRATHGKLVLFPDDDCWYPPDFLAAGVERMFLSEAQVVTGRAADSAGRSINGRFEAWACRVTPANVWTTSIEWVVFFQRNVLEVLGGFDQNIGIGADSPWQSCESQDIVLRAMGADFKCVYDPQIFGHHAELNVMEPDAAQIAKGRAYARGMGWVMRKHQVSWLKRLYWSARPLIKSLYNAAQGRRRAAHYNSEVAIGRWEGSRGRADLKR